MYGGYPQQGYPPQAGYPQPGYPGQPGYPPQGYPQQGYAQPGYPPQGMPPPGMMPPPGGMPPPGMMPPPGGMPPPAVAAVPLGPISTFVGTPEADADALRRAMQGAGTDDSEVIRVLANRTYAQRMVLAQAYQARFGRSLKDDLHNDTGGNYRKLLELLVSPRPFIIAECLHKAMAGAGTADYQLLTILTQFDQDMPGVPAAYQALYHKDITAEIKRETSGHFEDVLINCVLRRPQPPGFVNAATVQADAQAFYKAGQGRIGTNDKEYIRILTANTNAHLQAVDNVYRTLDPKGMMAAIKSETSGNYGLALQSLMTPHHRWMAQAINHAVDRPGTEEALILIVFGLHDKQDLIFIRNEYRTMFQKDMMTDLKKDLSGNFERLCVAMMA